MGGEKKPIPMTDTPAHTLPAFVGPAGIATGCSHPSPAVPGPHLCSPDPMRRSLTEADLHDAVWLRERIPENLMEAMHEGQRDFLTKPAHRFIPGQKYSICGAKLHKGEPDMIRACVPANRAERDKLLAAGKMMCRDCIRISWVRSDTLVRSCPLDHLRDMPTAVPASDELTPVQFKRFLSVNSDQVLPARLVAVQPCSYRRSPALQLHFDATEDRKVAYTPVSMVLPHLDSLRMIHKPRTIILTGL